MNLKKPWLDALKKTIEEEPQLPREDSEKSKTTTVQNMQKPREAEHEAGGEVVDLNTARVLGSEDERRLLAASWSPKDRCGPLELTIWADPETCFYCSREIALHRLDQDSGAGDGV